MAHFNEQAWKKIARETRFPIENASGSVLNIGTISGSVLNVSTISGSAIDVSVPSGSYLPTSISSSLSNAVHIAMPLDYNIEMKEILSLLLEEQRKTNLYLSEIVGDLF